eukprot:21335_1
MFCDLILEFYFNIHIFIMASQHPQNAPKYSKVRSHSNPVPQLSTDSFNLYNGMIYDKPESPKQRSPPLVHKLLCITLSIISLLILLLAMNNTSTIHKNTHNINSASIHSKCAHYPIHKECAIDTCNNQILSLQFGWSFDFVMLRKYDALNMLYSIDDEQAILPTVLFLNTMHDEDDFMEFDNISIALGDIVMDIIDFCCYSRGIYEDIKQMFETYKWKQFDIGFGNYTCLNKTDGDRIDVVSLLNDESQWLMTQWTNSFEDYLIVNGVDVQSRMNSLFYSTFAIFNDNISVDFVSELNTESTQEWQDIVVSFSKMNLRMT